ncbi:MAG: enoyl-CoA hydratase/isomerase family protein [Bacteroidetes bacterium]|nr:enoyl-CoA hydratase/isomerase family protein [Bacteroidota bacterium]
MNYKTISYKKLNNLAHLELSNPPGNAMSMQFFDELLDVCENEIVKEDYDGLIISSQGRHFSSGADVKELLNVIKSSDKLVPEAMAKNLRAIEILHMVRKPKVAILKGVCYGSGFELALTANYRIAQNNTLIALPEVTFGLMPGLGGVSALTNFVGEAKALEMILSGESINAEDALRLGIVNIIADKEQLISVAVDFVWKNNN